ncbi:MAG: chemotaxis protein CheW [Deltaproteobacteria bacterium]|nr:chemotaxis protein CheW [Deltaproteobacteria bacterium]
MSALVLFEVAGVKAALRATDVLEVVAVRDVTPVPAGPDFLAGVFAHRGAVVPLVDGAERLGGHRTSEPRRTGRALLLATQLGPIGLTIDRIADVGDAGLEDHVLLDVEALVHGCRGAVAA